MILNCSNIDKTFVDNHVLKNASFHIEDYEKAAIVGINGAGKSTLLKIIVGDMPADSGQVTFGKDKSFGYLAQHQAVDTENSIFDELLTVKQEVLDLEASIRQTELDMKSVDGAELEALLKKYSSMTHRFEDINGYAYKSEVTGILKGLGYNESTRALYLTEIFYELSNILYKFKSNLDTLNGLAGFGDLVLTCSSEKSRNFSYGEMIGKKKSKKDTKKYLEDNTVEGVNTLNSLYPILKRKRVKCPIINVLYDILYNDKNPQELTKIIIKKSN